MLEDWAKQVAGGDRELLAKRLGFDGLTPERLAPALAEDELEPGCAWLAALEELLDRGGAAGDAPLPRDTSGQVQPLAAAFQPWVAGATEALSQAVVNLPLTLCPRAISNVQRFLSDRLHLVARRALQVQLTASRLTRDPLAFAHPATPDEQERFARSMDAPAWLRLLCRYPVLGRMLATVVRCWIASNVELCQRLVDDLPQLSALAGGQLLPHVTDIALGLSDPHHEGRTVGLVTIADELRIYYKPRSVSCEAAYASIVEHLNRAAAGRFDLRTPRIIDRGGYGWVEAIEPAPCVAANQVAAAYRRLGAHLFLARLLGVADLHPENIVVAGEHPYIVDLEVMMARPVRGAEARATAADRVQQVLHDSVLGSGLLPAWHRRGADGACSFAGLSEPDHVALQPANDLVWIPARTPHRALPRLGARTTSPREHLDSLCDGFAEMYRFVASLDSQLLRPGGALAALRRSRTRFMVRGTYLYARLLDRTLWPDALRDGAQWSTLADRLAVAFVAEPSRPRLWPVVAVERAALLRAEVPRFSAPAESRDLCLDGGGVIEDAFREDGPSGVERRLRTLCPEDLAQQLSWIRTAFHLDRRVDEEDWPAAAGPRRRAVDPAEGADAIAQRLSQLAIEGEEGSATWVAVQPVGQSGRFAVGDLDPSLYGGLLGVALFLATHARVRGSRRSRRLARAACQAAAAQLERTRARSAPRQSLGLSGLGGCLFALGHLAALLQADDLVRIGQELVKTLGAASRGRTVSADLIDGDAGAVLGLVAFHRQTLDRSALVLACTLGERLAALSAADGLPEEPGAAHGRCGASQALLRLAGWTDAASIQRAAQIARQVVRRRLVLPQGRARGSWCRGVVGRGVAALLADDRATAAAAAEIAAEIGASPPDHLCCGASGRISFLVEAGRRLARPDYGEHARRLLVQLLGPALDGGGHRFYAPGPADLNPGLFTGLAGIGLAALQVAAPAATPSVLTWE